MAIKRWIVKSTVKPADNNSAKWERNDNKRQKLSHFNVIKSVILWEASVKLNKRSVIAKM